MRPTEKQLYNFMTSCGGNWRNTLYVRGSERDGGILLAFDRDARPALMTVAALREVSGELIEPEECRAAIDYSAFRDIFRQYFLWHAVSDEVGLLVE